ncbi:hypothetical protein Thermo_01836 [Thermoplasmatales archaeon]|nr:hypothetical protein Thermo_01836 [Thermoplasmatales archaeon]
MIQLFPAPITNTLITMEGRSYNVNWKIYGINGTSEVPEVTEVISMRVVNDTDQNSVFMLLRNSRVQVAEIYDSSGNPVGYIVNSVDLYRPVVAYGNGDHTGLNTIFVPTSSSTYGVNSVSQIVSFFSGNRSIGDPHLQVYPGSTTIGYFQNFQNSEAGVTSESLSALSVAIAFAALVPEPGAPVLRAVSAAIGLLALMENTASQTSFTLSENTNANDYFSYNVSAGSQTSDPSLCGRVGGSYCDLAYNTLGVRYGLFDLNFHASYIFNVYSEFYYNVTYDSILGGSYPSPGYIGTLNYTTDYVIVGSPDTNVYYASNALYYTMAGS